jgi:hypothetical protein
MNNKKIVIGVVFLFILIIFLFFFLIKYNTITSKIYNINPYLEEEYNWIEKNYKDELKIENVIFSIKDFSFDKEKQYVELEIKNGDDLFVHEISFNCFIYDGNNRIIFNNYILPINLQKSYEKRVNAQNITLFVDDEMEYKYVDGQKRYLPVLDEEKIIDISNGKIYFYAKMVDKNYNINISNIHLVLYNFKCRTQISENEYKNIDTKNLVYDFKIN